MPACGTGFCGTGFCGTAFCGTAFRGTAAGGIGAGGTGVWATGLCWAGFGCTGAGGTGACSPEASDTGVCGTGADWALAAPWRHRCLRYRFGRGYLRPGHAPAAGVTVRRYVGTSVVTGLRAIAARETGTGRRLGRRALGKHGTLGAGRAWRRLRELGQILGLMRPGTLMRGRSLAGRLRRSLVGSLRRGGQRGLRGGLRTGGILRTGRIPRGIPPGGAVREGALIRSRRGTSGRVTASGVGAG